jgi:1,4-dihydroxy-2-naphthoate octaprenyltransferase
VWLEAARPKTLPAAVIPVLVGSALAWRADAFAWFPALLCLGFSLLVQIGTNFANDYGDFVKGADTAERLGPRRAVAAGLIAPRAMAAAAVTTFTIAFAVGLGLVWIRGWELLPVGIVSLLFGWAYTSGPYPLAYHGLGDVFVFIFFGLVAVGGTFYVQAGELPLVVLLAAVPIGLLATNILVVNNHRDADTDARAHKRTLVVRFGRGFAVAQYASSFAVALLVPPVLAWIERSWWLAAPLVLAPLAVRLTTRLRASPPGPGLNVLLADTARFLLVFGIVWSAALTWR